MPGESEHRRKVVKNCGEGAVERRTHSNGGADRIGVWAGVIPLSGGGGVWGPRRFFNFVLRNVELLCILDMEQGDSTATVIAKFLLEHQQMCRISFFATTFEVLESHLILTAAVA